MKRVIKKCVAGASLVLAFLGASRPASAWWWSSSPHSTWYAAGKAASFVNVNGVNLNHTLTWQSGYGIQQICFGWNGVSIGTNGCCNNDQGSDVIRTTTLYGNQGTCMSCGGTNRWTAIVWAVTGVCHQGTNNNLNETDVPYVVNWGIGGGSQSYWWYGNYGASGFSWGADC